MSSSDLAAAARALGCDEVVECDTVEEACDRAIRSAEHDDAVLVTGSLYVVGAARPTSARSSSAARMFGARPGPVFTVRLSESSVTKLARAHDLGAKDFRACLNAGPRTQIAGSDGGFRH